MSFISFKNADKLQTRDNRVSKKEFQKAYEIYLGLKNSHEVSLQTLLQKSSAVHCQEVEFKDGCDATRKLTIDLRLPVKFGGIWYHNFDQLKKAGATPSESFVNMTDIVNSLYGDENYLDKAAYDTLAGLVTGRCAWEPEEMLLNPEKNSNN